MEKTYYYVAVVGSRNFYKKSLVKEVLTDVFKSGKVGLITGGARGVDTWAEEFAEENDIPVTVIRPINPANKIDYLYRNVEIITMADEVIAFWDGQSKGTKFVIDYATARSKDLTVYNDKRPNIESVD